MNELINQVIANIRPITDIVAYVVLIASVIVKLTPTLKDDNIFKGLIKFVGKYLALNKNIPSELNGLIKDANS